MNKAYKDRRKTIINEQHAALVRLARNSHSATELQKLARERYNMAITDDYADELFTHWKESPGGN